MLEMLITHVHENLLPRVAADQLYCLGLSQPGVEAKP